MTDKAERMREVIALIRNDLEADVQSFEGQPFTGEAVSIWYGRLAAAVDGLAGVVAELVPGSPGVPLGEQEPHHGVKVVRDRDGDLWRWTGPGQWCFTPNRDDEGTGTCRYHAHCSWEYVWEYQPLTDVTETPEGLAAL
jgi:hypothetical protein